MRPQGKEPAIVTAVCPFSSPRRTPSAVRHRRCADASSAFRLRAKPNADREVRAPRTRRTPAGARMSSSASRRRAKPNADREVRAPPHPPNRGRCADVLVRIPAPREAQCGPGGPRTPAPAERWRCADVLVRIPASRETQCGPGGPRTPHPPNPGRCADVLVRIPASREAQCGPGGPRTPHPPNPGRCADVLVRIPAPREAQCGPGGPRTPHPPNRGRCADVLVRIPAPARSPMRTGRSAHRARRTLEVRGRPRPHPGIARNPMRTGRSAHRAAAEHCEVRGRPRPHPGPVRSPMRTGRSAHPAPAEPREVRGRPRPHPGAARSPMRTGRSAHPAPNLGRCADVLVRIPAPREAQCVPQGNPDVLVRIPAPREAQCGPGGPRTLPPPNLGGARTSSSASRPRTKPNADREVRAPRTPPNLGGARTSSSASRPRAKPNADREVRAPAPAEGGARTSSSASRRRAKPNADREVRAPPHPPNPGEVRGRPRPHPGVVRSPLRTGRSAHPARRRTLGGARTSSSAFELIPPYQRLKRGSASPDPPAFRGRGSRSGTCRPWGRRSRSLRRRFPGARIRPPSSPGRHSGRRRPGSGRSP